MTSDRTSSPTSSTDTTGPTDDALLGRRSLLSGGAALLAGCGGSSSSGAAASTAAATTPAETSAAPSSEDSAPLAQLADIPVGSAVAATMGGKAVVVAQPTAGTAVAFSAICTHQGFTVTSVEGGTIMCNHHGSQYDAKTGAVKQGPAPAGLKKVGIVVKGTKIVAT